MYQIFSVHYFVISRHQRSQKRKDIAETEARGCSKNDRIYQDAPRVSRRKIEYALTELQLLCNCCYRMVDNIQDVGLMVCQFSKAIAQALYK